MRRSSLKLSAPMWLSGLSLLLIAPFFFIGGPDAYSSFLLKHVWNFGHIVFFALLLLLIQSFKSLAGWRAWLWVSLIAIALGGLIEFAQTFVGRNASADDVLHNLFGVWLGLFWGQQPSRLIWLLRLISVGLIVPSVWLVCDAAIAEVALRKQFPLLNSVESHHELQRLHGNNALVNIQQTQAYHAHGVSSAQITLDTKPYSGVSLPRFNEDWRGYTTLLMELYNPDAELLPLVVRISDLQHDRGDNQFNDRFNRHMLLQPGWNRIEIDLNEVRKAPHQRAMRMDQISDITIFAARLPVRRTFYLDNVRLLRSSVQQ